MKEVHPLVKGERNFYKQIYKDLVKGVDLSKPLSILDYGAGTGGFASLLAEYNPKIKVTAMDSNPEVIELGKEHYKHIPNLEFIVDEKIPQKKYDLIFKNLVLHELSGKGNKKIIKSSLKKAYKSLKEEGLISILDNVKVSKEEFKPIYESNKSPKKGTFEEEYKEHNKYTLKDWVEMLEKSGFSKEHSQELPPNLFHYRGKK